MTTGFQKGTGLIEVFEPALLRIQFMDYPAFVGLTGRSSIDTLTISSTAIDSDVRLQYKIVWQTGFALVAFILGVTLYFVLGQIRRRLGEWCEGKEGDAR